MRRSTETRGTSACLGFRIFGINVATPFPLPLPPAENATDVVVKRGLVAPAGELLFSDDGPPAPFSCYRIGRDVVLDWPEARFQVAEDRILIDCDDDMEATTFLLQPVWSVLLAARGQEALHGGAVERDGKAVAIMGTSGSGKSTALLKLLDAGWNLVTDDLLTFDGCDRVVPGPPFIRLTPDRWDGRLGEPDGSGKLRYRPSLADQPVPLGLILIHDYHYETLTPLNGLAAVDALLSQVYNPMLTHAGQAMRRFSLALRLTGQVPIVAVPPRSLTVEQVERLFETSII
jgi:hypothetical protein